jgi:hypothetical protein
MRRDNGHWAAPLLAIAGLAVGALLADGMYELMRWLLR